MRHLKLRLLVLVVMFGFLLFSGTQQSEASGCNFSCFRLCNDQFNLCMSENPYYICCGQYNQCVASCGTCIQCQEGGGFAQEVGMKRSILLGKAQEGPEE